jgi:hypothetical protein
MGSDAYTSRFFRIDRFVVPAASEEEFLRSVAETNTAFDGHVLKQQNPSGDSVYITFVEWTSEAAIARAREAAAAKHAELKMNPHQRFERLGIKAELGDFLPAVEFPA